jgi:2-oxoglutarate ferredoxin oxidoreductase subunit gamma
MYEHRIICSGFGGQGILSMGEVLAYAGMSEGRFVSWLPSYGPEMRGGTANCQVIISEKRIASPIIVEGTSVIAMNLPSLRKFEKSLDKKGELLINSSLVKEKTTDKTAKALYVPATEIARALGNEKVANMVMMGALIQRTKCLQPNSVKKSLKQVFGNLSEELFNLDVEAIKSGRDYVLGL